MIDYQCTRIERDFITLIRGECGSVTMTSAQPGHGKSECIIPEFVKTMKTTGKPRIIGLQ
jgi:hypothetical protein